MDVDYFIKKFHSIPNALWTVGDLYNGYTHQHCALGFCDNDEKSPLNQLFGAAGMSVTHVNDSQSVRNFKQATPKARILAALEYLKYYE